MEKKCGERYAIAETTYCLKACKTLNYKILFLFVKKVNGSLNRPGVAQRIPGGLGSQTSMTFGTCRW
jgi:hypothetical protein